MTDALSRRNVLKTLLALPVATTFRGSIMADDAIPDLRRAIEITDAIQKEFFDPASGVYLRSRRERKPDYIWLQSVQLSNLVAAARIDPRKYGGLLDPYFKALDAYWDSQARIPGYEAARTSGNGNDKYYDDNAWMVLALLEAYESNRNANYLNRAEATLDFVLSGWDDALGGGIWWHQGHKDGTKNTCANGPAAVGCLQLARFQPKRAVELVKRAREIVDWTIKNLQDTDGLFDDRKVVATDEIKRGKLTYNTALMIRSLIQLSRETGERRFLDEALRIGKAGDWFLDREGNGFRDLPRYGHFMIEADLELYRATSDKAFLDRARRAVDAYYEKWQTGKYDDLISWAAISRALWLISETGTEAGRTFWKKVDDSEDEVRNTYLNKSARSLPAEHTRPRRRGMAHEAPSISGTRIS